MGELLRYAEHFKIAPIAFGAGYFPAVLALAVDECRACLLDRLDAIFKFPAILIFLCHIAASFLGIGIKIPYTLIGWLSSLDKKLIVS